MLQWSRCYQQIQRGNIRAAPGSSTRQGRALCSFRLNALEPDQRVNGSIYGARKLSGGSGGNAIEPESRGTSGGTIMIHFPVEETVRADAQARCVVMPSTQGGEGGGCERGCRACGLPHVVVEVVPDGLETLYRSDDSVTEARG